MRSWRLNGAAPANNGAAITDYDVRYKRTQRHVLEQSHVQRHGHEHDD